MIGNQFPGRGDGRVAGLHRLVGAFQVRPDEDIKVMGRGLGVGDLRARHESFLNSKGEMFQSHHLTVKFRRDNPKC